MGNTATKQRHAIDAIEAKLRRLFAARRKDGIPRKGAIKHCNQLLRDLKFIRCHSCGKRRHQLEPCKRCTTKQ